LIVLAALGLAAAVAMGMFAVSARPLQLGFPPQQRDSAVEKLPL
jgi:hypothetical protein